MTPAAVKAALHRGLGRFAGTPTIFVTQPGWPPYILQLSWDNEALSRICDFRYVSYILNEFTG